MSNKYKILNSNVSANTHEFLVDEIADIRFLPAEPGSTAIVAENSDVYICNNAKQWIKFDSVNEEETVFPSGKITITENGTDIDITQYATADVDVVNDSGTSFGELQYSPLLTRTLPAVGESIPNPMSDVLPVSMLGADAQTMLVIGGITAIGIVEGIYITSTITTEHAEDAVDAYVCTIDFTQSKYATVTPWSGQLDVTGGGMGDITCGFSMPDVGGLDPQTNMPVAVLVLYAYKQ